jgi:hypothetical protein
MTLDNYIHGVTSQLERRVRELRLRIPRKLPRDYDALAEKCRGSLNGVLDDLRVVRDEYGEPESQAARIRHLRRTVSDLCELETIAIAALDRAREDDHQLNELLHRITREIEYPLVTPVVTTLSSEYFHIYPGFNLLAVPLSEGSFLLHLPDLYHELAHPLLCVRDEPLVDAFQHAKNACLAGVLDYLRDERAKAERRRSPESFKYQIRLWELAWIRSWLDEILCDLFAVYTLGPAFVWSHLHLSAIRGQEPFEVPAFRLTSHPADDARMRAMLNGLSLSGYADTAGRIEEAWRRFLSHCGAHAEPEYQRCYPAKVLGCIARIARGGVEGMGCRMATPQTDDPVHACLSDAWVEFWRDPSAYARWEETAVSDRLHLGKGSACGVLRSSPGVH